jgi:hypothetical protein
VDLEQARAQDARPFLHKQPLHHDLVVVVVVVAQGSD